MSSETSRQPPLVAAYEPPENQRMYDSLHRPYILCVFKCACLQVVLFFHVKMHLCWRVQNLVSVYPTLRTCMCQNGPWVKQPRANNLPVEHSVTHTHAHTQREFTLHLTQTESQGAISIWDYSVSYMCVQIHTRQTLSCQNSSFYG